MDQRDTIKRLCTSFPSLSVSEARALLEASNWNINSAIKAAERDEAEKIKKHGSTNFYAGDGQMTMSPGETQAKEDPKNLLNQLFEKAGAEQNVSESSEGGRAFYGQGRRLGHTENPSPPIAATLRPQRDSVLEVYENGFLLENGQFISLESPEGKEGCVAMNSGFVPPFLRNLFPNTDLTITLHDKSAVPYEPPSHVAFSGEGHKLSATAPAAPIPTSMKPFALNENEPTSFIMLVSTRGQRKEFKVNPDRHTVADVYGLAKQVEPELSAFTLLVREIPPRRLDIAQPHQTISEAKLSRAVITIQK